MPLQFPARRGSAEWFRMAEQTAEQHHVDIQRLWQVVPQVPDPHAGVPYLGPISPTLFGTPQPASSVSSSSSGP